MTPPRPIANAMREAGLATSLLEVLLTIDGAPIFGFVAPSAASLTLLDRLERGGGVQAVVLGDDFDLERWRRGVDDELREAFIPVPDVASLLAGSLVHAEGLGRMRSRLDDRPPPRRDFRSVLVGAVEETRSTTATDLIVAFAEAPEVEMGAPTVFVHDDEPAEAPKFLVVEGLWIALLPVERPHEVLALLRFGGFNPCPPPEIHIAVIRRWEESVGARVVVLRPDELVVRVARPPTTHREVHVVTLEQEWLGGDDRPSVGETKGSTWRWWWD